ncbi:hypothetical protein [Sulfitobacter pacificus]|uniref:DUF982 domain-containing protein n=1 Tax=Sulfitobacter pacificus TaxID=1499314 RepID=A0ABQ5VGF4_9RHOB|nr:hypothetical protein [Sulfitobacter pacificus]GLQ26156.1 hypothetical protein GCM10007927_09590 [Sulfitobacter pacificus]
MKAFVFDCRGRDVPPVMVVHAKCFEVAKREAVHRFERTWPRKEFKGACIDVSRAEIEPAEKYFDIGEG